MSVLQLIIATTKACCCCNIAAGQKCFSNPGRKLRKEKEQEFVFHLLFFYILLWKLETFKYP
jgi:hypothetical protein